MELYLLLVDMRLHSLAITGEFRYGLHSALQFLQQLSVGTYWDLLPRD
jgi:hypothetical protein